LSTSRRHCEERSDAAIQIQPGGMDCFAALAMTFFSIDCLEHAGQKQKSNAESP
jgi:hypothetical protein